MGKKRELISSEPEVIEALFDFEQLTLKKRENWRLKITVKKHLPEVFEAYGIRFVYDDTADLEDIEDLEKKILEAKDSDVLFEDEKKKDVARFTAQIKEANKALEDRRKKFEDIEGPCALQSIQYKEGNTVVVFGINADMVEPLNERRHQLGNYKVLLTRD